MDQIPQLLVNGISLGSIIALAAVGLTLTFGILRLSNFAHGEYMTLGAYLGLLFNVLINGALKNAGMAVQGLGMQLVLALIAIALATGVMVGYSLLAEKILWQPMRKKRATPTTLVILSIGLALFMRNGVILLWGTGDHRYDVSVPESWNLGLVRIRPFDLLVTLFAVGAITGVHYLLQNTKIGKAMRAVADDIDLAKVTGINVDRVVLWTWVIAGALTALAGGMLGLVEGIKPDMGWFLILPLFAAVTLGGIGNPYGAIAGAMMIAVAQELCTVLIPVQYKAGVALLLMMVVLLFRPQGLFRGTM
jgi:neutral amino acid transport system permease protein